MVQKQDVGRLLENLDVSKAMGPDGVSGWTLKECKEQLIQPIWEVITSYNRGGEGAKRVEEGQHCAYLQRRKED